MLGLPFGCAPCLLSSHGFPSGALDGHGLTHRGIGVPLRLKDCLREQHYPAAHHVWTCAHSRSDTDLARALAINLVVAGPRYCNGQPEGPVTSRIKSRSLLRCAIRHAAKRVVARSSHCLGLITAARGRYCIAIKRRRSSAHPIAVPVAPAAIVRGRPVVIDRSRPVIGIWIWPCQCAANYCAAGQAPSSLKMGRR